MQRFRVQFSHITTPMPDDPEYLEGINQLLFWLFNKSVLLDYNSTFGMYADKLLTDNAMREMQLEENQKVLQMIELANAGSISKQAALASLGLDPKEEQRMLKELACQK